MDQDQSGDSDSSQPSCFNAILAHYQDQLAKQETIVHRCVSRWGRVGMLRGILFLAALGLLLLGFATYLDLRTLWFVLSGIAFAAFLIVAFIHEGMQTDLKVARLLAQMHKESIGRLKRDWKSVEDRPVALPDSVLPISFDLDLFGSHSLFKLLNVCRTPRGVETLRDWVITGAMPDEVALRQGAVQELSRNRDWIEQFRLKCEQLSLSKSGPEKFVEWCESPDWFARHGWVLWAARVMAGLSVLSILVLLTGVVSPVLGALGLVVAFVINFGLAVVFSGGIHDAFNMVSSRSTDIYYYVQLFDLIEKFDAKSEKLAEIKSRMFTPGQDVRKNIGALSQLVWMANLRRHGILFLVYLFVEFLFFWDPHVLNGLEKWKKQHGHKARTWFDDLGTWEALTSLGLFAADHPDWVYPDVHEAEPENARIIAEEFAHPMLGNERVANSVSVGPSGTVLLVSGSNMSGKSTLLRTIGINAILAQMGSVVCAKQFSMPPLHLETSMKIFDSMADGVSFFMAELKRLKEIVDQAKTYRSKPKTMLFLLDEILQGTNSRERQIAVSRVVRKLIDDKAIGAISTHDLDLATTPELESACQSVHFTEEFFVKDGQRQMTFDYKMRHGIAETTNALKLLEMVGLGDDD